MLKLVDGIVELYKKVATSIPPDIEEALRNTLKLENPDSNAYKALEIILENIKLARKEGRPICQDTGIPIFSVKLPSGLVQRDIKEIILEATTLAIKKVPLRANNIDIINDLPIDSDKDSGMPIINFSEHERQSLIVDLMLKGAGCENAGRMYKLPDMSLNAQRDLDGIRRCVIDAVIQIQGKACPPYTIAVAVGGSRDQVTALSKKLLFNKINTINPSPTLAKLEETLLADINSLNIGTAGLSGAVTAFKVIIGAQKRHPASFFVDVSFACWANRRGRLIWS
ncbi:MAG: fumarate hydratase [Nitrospirae bacterium]|nr:fumarate hydratase [Nitrospirota bacterium]